MKTVPIVERDGRAVVELPDNKPTWLSTEFWLRTIQILSGLAVTTGLFDPGTVQIATDMTTNLVGPAMQLIGMIMVGGGARGYNQGRVQIKTKAA